MDNKVLIGIAVMLVLLICGGVGFAYCGHKQAVDLSADVQGRWEYVLVNKDGSATRDRILTVSGANWRVEKWDDATKGWHPVAHGTWTVSDSGTFLFNSDLTGAQYTVRIEGQSLFMDTDRYNKMK